MIYSSILKLFLCFCSLSPLAYVQRALRTVMWKVFESKSTESYNISSPTPHSKQLHPRPKN